MTSTHRGILFLISFAFVHFSFAQDIDSLPQNDSLPQKLKFSGYTPIEFSLSNFYGDETGKQFQSEVGFTSSVLLHSNAFTLPVSLALLRNEFITDEMKNEVSTNLQSNNSFELTYDVEVFGKTILDSFIFSKPALWGIDVSWGSFYGGQFPGDAFNIIAYGNASYAGKTADMSNTNLYLYNYSRIGISTQIKNGEKNSREAGVRLSLSTLRSGIKTNIPHATLFTEQNGEYLDADYNFEYMLSDSSNHGDFSADGVALSTDLNFSWMNKDHTSRFGIYVNNLGIMMWNGNTRSFSADTMIHFEGLVIDNLLSTDTGFFHYNIDSLKKNTGIKEEIGKRSFSLPARFAFVYSHSLSQKFLLHAGISYMPYTDRYPMIFLKPQWVASSHWQLSIPVSAGGAYNYALGFDMQIIIKKQLKVVLGSDNIIGLMFPHQTTSSSLFLQSAFQF